MNRRSLLAGGTAIVGGATLMPSRTKAQTVLSAEGQYWQDQAALLDPRAYSYEIGPNWSLQVPPGETWYALNIWGAYLAGSRYPTYHRDPGVDNAFQLPAGTTLSASGTPDALVYYCRPSLVWSDPRYANAQQLYYNRLAQLASLPLETLSCYIPTGPYKPNTDGIVGALFPSNFTTGMVRHYNVFNSPWITMNGPPQANGIPSIIAMGNEIDDGRAWRITRSCMFPWPTALFSGMWLRFGTVDQNRNAITGDFLPNAIQVYPADGEIAFQRLPENW